MRGEQGGLHEPREPDGSFVQVHERCVVRIVGEHRLVLVSGIPVAHDIPSDRRAEAPAIVNLVEAG